MGLWQQTEVFWNDSRAVAWILVVVWTAIAVWALYAVPSPGIAIGLLAAGAGIMSLRSQMHILEKLGWIAILVALTTAEFTP